MAAGGSQTGDFDVAVRVEQGYDLVTARGDLDAASASRFRHLVQDSQLCAQDHMVVDLSGLGFLDSIGVSALVAARRLANSLSKTLVLACAEGQVLRVLHLVGLHQVMGVYPTVADAVGALDRS